MQVRTLLLSIQALLSAPNPDDPLNNTAAEHWKKNEKSALEQARAWTKGFLFLNHQSNFLQFTLISKKKNRICKTINEIGKKKSENLTTKICCFGFSLVFFGSQKKRKKHILLWKRLFC